MEWQTTLQQLREWTGMNSWVVQVFMVVFISLFLDYIQRRVLRRLHDRLQSTRTLWDDAIIAALQKPLTLLIWVLGLTFATEIIYQETETPIFAVVGPIRDVGVIASIAWFLLRLASNAQDNLIREGSRSGKTYDRTTVDAIGKLIRLSIAITAALVTLQTLGFSVSGVLAFGGIGGIAVGFAAKDLLANFFGGLMIYLDRPFAVGDWVRSPDRELEGTVEAIGWRLTRIRTFDKRPLYVPNSVFTSVAVENPSRMTHRRIHEVVGIRYDDVDQMDDITRDVKAMLQNHEAIDESQTLMVYFNRFSSSSLDFFVYTFTHTTVWTEFHAIKHEILLQIHDIIRNHGAEIAFPTTTVHFGDGPGEGPWAEPPTALPSAPSAS